VFFQDRRTIFGQRSLDPQVFARLVGRARCPFHLVPGFSLRNIFKFLLLLINQSNATRMAVIPIRIVATTIQMSISCHKISSVLRIIQPAFHQEFCALCIQVHTPDILLLQRFFPIDLHQYALSKSPEHRQSAN